MFVGGWQGVDAAVSVGSGGMAKSADATGSVGWGGGGGRVLMQQ